VTLPARWLACFLSTAVPLAAALPCPTPETAAVPAAHHAPHTGPATSHAGHDGHVVHAMAGHSHAAASPERGSAAPCHEPPALSAPCPCGCDRAGPSAAGGGGRLGAVLPSHAVAARGFRAALRVRAESPRLPVEPCSTPDPIPI
jgi:uncharacterized protein involved in copper resistance